LRWASFSRSCWRRSCRRGLLLLEAALLLLGVGGGLLLLALEAALGLGELGGGVGVLAGGLAEGLLGGGHGPLERLHVGLVGGGGVLGVGEGLLGALGVAAARASPAGRGDGLLLERLGELAHALGEDRRVGVLGGLELGLGLGELLLELLEPGERGGAVDLPAGEGDRGPRASARRSSRRRRCPRGAGAGPRAAARRGSGRGPARRRSRGRALVDGDVDAVLHRRRDWRDEHGREDSQRAGPAEQEVAAAGARERDDGARVEARRRRRRRRRSSRATRSALRGSARLRTGSNAARRGP
jgi:hypothetical protein